MYDTKSLLSKHKLELFGGGDGEQNICLKATLFVNIYWRKNIYRNSCEAFILTEIFRLTIWAQNENIHCLNRNFFFSFEVGRCVQILNTSKLNVNILQLLSTHQRCGQINLNDYKYRMKLLTCKQIKTILFFFLPNYTPLTLTINLFYHWKNIGSVFKYFTLLKCNGYSEKTHFRVKLF